MEQYRTALVSRDFNKNNSAIGIRNKSCHWQYAAGSGILRHIRYDEYYSPSKLYKLVKSLYQLFLPVCLNFFYTAVLY